jgi:hypothetical protein
MVRPVLANSGALEVTRSGDMPAPALGSAATRRPATVATAKARVGRPTGAVGAARLASPETPAAPSERIASVGAPTTAPTDDDTAADISAAPGADRASGASTRAAVAPAANPTVHFCLLSAGDARRRFGADLGAAGLLAGRLGIVNRTARAYLVSIPLVTLRRASGESVAPVRWSDASARIAESPAAHGWETYDEMSRELATDQVLEPGTSLSGILLYPAADYASVQVLLIDQQSARRERFEGAVPPAPRQ